MSKDKPSKLKAAQPKTKLVVRKLPECTTEEHIKKLLEPYTGQYDYFNFEKPSKLYKLSSTKSSKIFYSRFYINFKEFSNIIPFVEHFKKIEFPISKKKNNNNNEIKTIQAIVEYAPYQKIPLKQKKTRDKRIDTIYKDEDYMKFIEKNENENKKKIEYLDKILPKILDSNSGSLPKHLIENDIQPKVAPLAKYLIDNKYRNKRVKTRRLYMTRRQLERERIRERERLREEKRLKREHRKHVRSGKLWEKKSKIDKINKYKPKNEDIVSNKKNEDMYHEKRFNKNDFYEDKTHKSDYYGKRKTYKDDYYEDKPKKYKDDKYYNNDEYYDDKNKSTKNKEEHYEDDKYYNNKSYNNYYDDYSYSKSRNYYRGGKRSRGGSRGGRTYKQKKGYEWNRK